MRHAACHLAVSVLSRAEGRSSVAAAAYRAGVLLVDERTGRSHDYRLRTDVLSSEVIGWQGDLGGLWRAAEAAETRGDARTAREARIALPAELPHDAQVRLVRGYALWLRDTYGVAAHAAIHEPRWRERRDDEDEHPLELLRRDRSEAGRTAYLAALADPALTNLNVHAHVMWTTRAVDPKTGAFGAKTRILDDRRTGGEEILRCRQEWERRANAALAKAGAQARVDLRSYEAQAAAGDAPEGLVAQNHLGPKWTALSRKLTDREGVDHSRVGLRRAARRAETHETWTCWLQLRALLRERAREEDSARIAAEREAARRREAEAQLAALEGAWTERERAEAAAACVHLTAPRGGPDALLAAIAAAQATGDGGAGDRAWDAAQRGSRAGAAGGEPAGTDFDAPIDPETYVAPAPDHPPDRPMRTARPDPVRERRRGE